MKPFLGSLSETIFEGLLDKLMQITLETTEAQKVIFIINESGKLLIEAMKLGGNPEVTVEQSIPVEDSKHLPLSVIHYIAKTHQPVILIDATTEPTFATDAYIQLHKPRSLLGTPILNKGQLIGILYLENSLTTGVFTPECLKALKLLIEQIFISLENARLYKELKAYSQEFHYKHKEILDVNKRLEIEIAERQQVELALRQSEERLQAILNNSITLIYIKDIKGQYLLVSRQFSALFPIDIEDILGKTDYDFLPHEIADILRANDKKVLTSGKALKAEEVVLQNDGLHTYISSKVPLYNADGVVYAVCGISTDITDRKQIEAQIRQFNETLEFQVAERTAQLEATNRELDSFSYSVSHDLRAPLRHIRGFANALKLQMEKHEVSAESQVAHYFKMIENSSQKMAHLIDGLLTLSRLGRGQLEKKPVNLATLVESAIALIQYQTSEVNRSIIFEVGDLPIVMGDAALLQQVLTNLIDNAVKFSRDRCPARIAIGTLQDRTIFVRDNGVGFDMEYADQLFGAFQRLHSEKEFEGTGIGLATVQRIIHRHGGKIWAESKLNVGTTFYFKLDSPAKE